MTSRFSDHIGGLPVLDTLKDHLPSSLLDQLADFVGQLIASRRTLQTASETYRQERDRFRTALMAAFRVDQESSIVPFLNQSLDLAARTAAADTTALALQLDNSDSDGPPILVTRHCTEADEAFIRAELYADEGILEQARVAGTPVSLPDPRHAKPRVDQALAARHVKSALILPFLAAPGKPARGVLYLEHMSRPRAFQENRPLIQACLEFIALGVTARERVQTTSILSDHTASLRAGGRYAHLAGRSSAFADALRRIDLLRLSRVDGPVVFVGEKGVGKEALARTVYAQGVHASGPFLTVDCAAFPGPSEQEECLLGSPHRAASMVGQGSRGLFFDARGGAVYLQNVHALAPSLQHRLVRALDMRVFSDEKDGSPAPFDVQLLVSSPTPLTMLAKEGRFLVPLAERLSLFQVELPPLRKRREDISPLAEHFLAFYGQKHGREGLVFSAAALRELERRPWPGNLDELEAHVEHAAESCPERVIDLESSDTWAPGFRHEETFSGDWKTELGAFQRRLIVDAMTQADGNVAKAAERLNISRQYLNTKLKALGLNALRKGTR